MSGAPTRTTQTLWLAVLAFVMLGCDRGLPALQADLDGARKEEQRLLALLDQLTRQNSALKAAHDAEENRSKRANAQLREAQVNLVETWKGEASRLAEKKKEATGLTPTLSAALDTAQTVAGGEVVEKRFARAIAAKNPADITPLVAYWESNWLDQNVPEPEPEEPKVCPTTRSLACTTIDDDSLWCPDASQNAAWAMLLDNGQLTVSRLVAGQSHEVDARLAPRVWLTRVGKEERGFVFLHALKGSSFMTVWQGRTMKDGVRLESHKANLDEDAYTEGLFWSADELLLADPTSRDDVTLLRDSRACEALELVDSVPPPVRQRCLKLLAPPAAIDGGVDGGP